MKKILNSTIDVLFPALSVVLANIKIKREENDSVNEGNNEYMAAGYSLLDKYNNMALERKNILESKAKTNIATLTISTSLAVNLYSLIIKSYKNSPCNFMIWILYILSILSVVYMFTAAILSVSAIIKYNEVYIPNIKDEIEENKDNILNYINQNNKNNIIRNNLIYGSYGSIRNSGICLVIIFIVTVFPWNLFQ